MKKTMRTIPLLLVMTLLLASGTMAQDRINSNDQAESISEIVKQKLGGHELPMEATVVIPDDFIPDDTPYEHYYPEHMTDEEIEVVICRIANGEHVMLGDGVIDREENPTRWKQGSNGHQWITARAFDILQKDKPSVYNWFLTSEKAAAISYSDWPDNHEGFLMNISSWHFYHSPSGTNYFRNHYDLDNARSRFDHWYKLAVQEGRNSNWVVAAQNLGKAIHYLSDLGTPPHTGDRSTTNFLPDIPLGDKHTKYETDAQAKRGFFVMSSSPYYTYYSTYSAFAIAGGNAAISYSYYANCYKTDQPSLRDPTIEWPMRYVQQDIAGLLYKYYLNVMGVGPI
ncbi:MAG: zinc dependent phospholipase C family protein [Oscillospiraceae bacterium]|nr:zinc dependent phospholipase C family protein [Oscillospiraceae bacterium]